MPVRSALITGAATGIGLALARKLDHMGWRVFAGFDKTPPMQLLHGVSERLTALPVNITNEVQIDKAVHTIERIAGVDGLQLLINNAATTGAPGPVETVDIEAFKQVMEVNLWGHIRVTQALLPLLRWGAPSRIVMVTSPSVYLTIPLGCSYPTSKQALSAITRHLRMELAPFEIEVSALEIGSVTKAATAGTPEQEIQLWESIPSPLCEQYQAAFTCPGKGIQEVFELESAESYAEQVYQRIICARRLRPRYTLGKGVGFLPLMQRLLPERALERVFRKLFRVKAKAGFPSPHR
jgi:NAD(P)-dependent dehydrogenase (short-subunit alcohol dehydrogenase family)